MNESIEDRWFTAYAMSETSTFLFVMVVEQGISAMIPKSKKPDLKLGDFLRVRIRQNLAAESQHRARHFVFECDKIEPPCPVRIETGHVILTTTAKITRTTNFNGNQIHILENNTFGSFIDVRNVIPRVDVAKFDFKCQASPLSKILSIFVPIKYLGRGSLPNGELRRRSPSPEPVERQRRARSRSMSVGAPIEVVGFVGHEDEDHYWVWCKRFERDIFMAKQYSPMNKGLISKWVRMQVVPESLGYRYKVIAPVFVINDVAPTRTECNVPELFVKMIFDGDVDDGYPCLNSDIVGNVIDCEEMILGSLDGTVINGWISRYKRDGIKSRWKLSPKQTRESLFEKSPESERSERSSRIGNTSSVPARQTPLRRSRSIEPSKYTPAVGNSPHVPQLDDDSDDAVSESESEESRYSNEEFKSNRNLDKIGTSSDAGKIREEPGRLKGSTSYGNLRSSEVTHPKDDWDKRSISSAQSLNARHNYSNRPPSASHSSFKSQPKGGYHPNSDVTRPISRNDNTRISNRESYYEDKYTKLCSSIEYFISNPKVQTAMKVMNTEAYMKLRETLDADKF